MSRVFCVGILCLLCTTPAYSGSGKVNRAICNSVESRIDSVREQQRKPNQAARADFLNRQIRKYKNQLGSCKERGYIK